MIHGKCKLVLRPVLERSLSDCLPALVIVYGRDQRECVQGLVQEFQWLQIAFDTASSTSTQQTPPASSTDIQHPPTRTLFYANSHHVHYVASRHVCFHDFRTVFLFFQLFTTRLRLRLSIWEHWEHRRSVWSGAFWSEQPSAFASGHQVAEIRKQCLQYRCMRVLDDTSCTNQWRFRRREAIDVRGTPLALHHLLIANCIATCRIWPTKW